MHIFLLLPCKQAVLVQLCINPYIYSRGVGDYFRESVLGYANLLLKFCSRNTFLQSFRSFEQHLPLCRLGYLSSNDNSQYLPNVVTSTLKSIVAESDNRMSRLIFKLAVELAMTMNIIASSQDIDKMTLTKLRGECVKEVKRLNGSFSFNDAYDWQKG